MRGRSGHHDALSTLWARNCGSRRAGNRAPSLQRSRTQLRNQPLACDLVFPVDVIVLGHHAINFFRVHIAPNDPVMRDAELRIGLKLVRRVLLLAEQAYRLSLGRARLRPDDASQLVRADWYWDDLPLRLVTWPVCPGKADRSVLR